MSAAADDVRVREARRRLAGLPPDTELPAATPVQLITWLVRASGAAQMLDAWVREHDGAVTLTAEQAAVVVKALGDASEYRRRRASDWCDECEDHPAGACDHHLEDLDRASRYAGLLDELGGAW